MAAGLWAVATTQTRAAAARVAGKFGIEIQQRSPEEEASMAAGRALTPMDARFQQAVEQIKRQATQRPQDVVASSSSSSSSSTTPSAATTPGTNRAVQPAEPDKSTPSMPPRTTTTTPATPNLRGGSGDKASGGKTDDERTALVPFLPSLTVNKDTFKVFQLAYMDSKLMSSPPPPVSGAIAISGLIQYESATSYVTLDMLGFWDPRTRKFQAGNFEVRLRKVQPKMQRPMA